MLFHVLGTPPVALRDFIGIIVDEHDIGKHSDIIAQELAKQDRGDPVAFRGLNRACRRGAFEDHMQDNVIVAGVQVVPVRLPAGCVQMHFHIPGMQLPVELDLRASKVRAFLVIPPAGRQHLEAVALRRAQL